MSPTSFDGWECYPENLPIAKNERFTYDLEQYNASLKADSQQLFVENDEETLLQVTEIGSPPQKLDGLLEVEQYLQKSVSFSGCRFILVPQETSLGQIWISERAARKLLTHLGAFPPVLDTLRAFGERRGDEERTGPCYASRTGDSGKTKESTWLLQHVELHGREDQSDPWSIRRMGFYRRKGELLGQETLVVVNPSDRFKKRIKTVVESNSAGQDIVLLLMSTTTRNWRIYLDYLETRLDILNKKIKQIINYDVEFSHMLEVQNLRHKLCLARTAVSRNAQVLAAIKAEYSNSQGTADVDTATSVEYMSRQFQIELESIVTRADNLMIRLDGASTLVDSILNYNATKAAQASNEKAGQMAVLARSDNKLMMRMTKKSVADARTLKTITILTLIYLPASFVSTFLGMNYVSVEKTHPITIVCKSEMVIFAVLTIALLAFTIGLWIVLEIRQHRTERREEATRHFAEKSWA